MAEGDRVVDVWVGRFASRERLDAYVEESYDDDAAPISAFAADMGATFYDHDFFERSFSEGKPSAEALLAGHSYFETFAAAAAARWDEVQASGLPFQAAGAPPLNAVLVAYDEQIDAPCSARGEGYVLHYVGRFDYALPPEPAGPEVPEAHHSGRVTVARFVGERLALTGSRHGEVRFWDTATGRAVPIELAHSRENWVHAADGSADGSVVVTVSDEVVLWEPQRAEAQVLGSDGGYNIEAVAVSPDAAWAVVPSIGEQGVAVWDLAQRERVATFSDHEAHVNALAVVGDGVVASVDRDGAVVVWRPADQTIVQRGSVGGSVKTLRWSAALELLVAGLWNGRLVGWRPREGAIAFEGAHGTCVEDLALTADGLRAVTAGGRTLKHWDLTDGRLLAELVGHTDTVRGVAIGSGRAVSGSRDASVRVWDLDVGSELARIDLGPLDRPVVEAWKDDPYAIRRVAVDASGRRIVAGGTSGRVHLLRYAAGRLTESA